MGKSPLKFSFIIFAHSFICIFVTNHPSRPSHYGGKRTFCPHRNSCANLVFRGAHHSFSRLTVDGCWLLFSIRLTAFLSECPSTRGDYTMIHLPHSLSLSLTHSLQSILLLLLWPQIIQWKCSHCSLIILRSLMADTV